MNRQFFYRSPEVDGGGGPIIQPSLDDVGGGTDVGFEQTDAEKAAAAKQVGIGGVPKDADITDPTPDPNADPNAKPDDVADKAQRLPETEEEKTTREAAEAEAAKLAEEGEGDDPAEGEGFFDVVSKLRGDDFDQTLKYPEGVDPTTPEGVHFRDKALEERAEKAFEQSLKQTDPRGYAYLLHRQNGGSDEEFLGKGATVLPDLEVMKDSVDLQREVYRQGLVSQGLPEKQVKALIEMAIKDGELSAEAEAMHSKMKAAEDKALADASKLLEDSTKQRKEVIDSFASTLDKEILEGTNLKFVIPDAEKPKFLQYVKENVHYEDGKFFLVKPITKENLAEQLQTELFGHLKGDIKKLVERKAKSLVANKLTLGTKGKPDPKVGPGGGNGGFTLGQI